MSFKIKSSHQDSLDKPLECPFANDCILKARVSCAQVNFPDFLQCTDYDAKKKRLLSPKGDIDIYLYQDPDAF